jgi:hypothetical protein
MLFKLNQNVDKIQQNVDILYSHLYYWPRLTAHRRCLSIANVALGDGCRLGYIECTYLCRPISDVYYSNVDILTVGKLDVDIAT